MNCINITELIDRGRLGIRQVIMFAIGFLCVTMDGFDVQSMGYVAPAIIKELHFEKSTFGLIFSAGFVGMTLGSIGLGVVADKIGKRPVLIFAATFLAICMLAVPHATTLNEFMIIRFLTGISMGTFIPNLVALIGEYSPARIRIRMMLITASGFVAGGALGGFLAAVLIPAFGWRSVFYVAATIAAIVAGLMAVGLPESLLFLVLRNKNLNFVRSFARQLDKSAVINAATTFKVNESSAKSAYVSSLYTNGLASGTALLWVANFTIMLCIYFFANWLPVLIVESGRDSTIAIYTGTAFWVGGVIGCWALGSLLARLSFGPTLLLTFCLGMLCVFLIGTLVHTALPLFVAVAGAGFCLLGTPPLLNALAAIFYPTVIRPSGMGWAQGVGRLGSIFGPLIGGELLKAGWHGHYLFYFAAAPMVLGAMSALGFCKLGIPKLNKSEVDAMAEVAAGGASDGAVLRARQ